jgi:hypothetical protein
MKQVRVAMIATAVSAVTWVMVGAQQFDLSWHTVDGGGAMFSTGGTFELGGTIGQAEAGPTPGEMTGGDYSIVGGFWPGAATPSCACLGDMNVDGQRNGSDLQLFVDCMMSGGSCQCADINGQNGITLDDADAFVLDLLGAGSCP